MATTTATITLSSSDITDNALSISNTATLTTAGTDTGITEFTGIARVKTSTGSNTLLLDFGLTGGVAQDVTADKSAKVYIKNVNDRGDGTKYVDILIKTREIGRLYGGDWMFIPYSGGTGEDIEYTASDTTETILEYGVFYEQNMATFHHNITGELTQELLAAGDNANISSVSLTNIHGSNACTVEMYIEKKLTGKFYLFKDVTLPIGATLIYDDIKFNNNAGQFGLFIKLTKSASETPAVDVIIN